jgi:hypothetical protein
MVLRYTCYQQVLVVSNLGDEMETFSTTIDIYDELDERVFHLTFNTFNPTPLDPGEQDTLYGKPDDPEWEPGELGQTYTRYVFTELAGDTDPSNDTLVDTVYVYCDDTLRYLWDYSDQQSPQPGIQPPAYFFTSYEIDKGVLITGGRVRTPSLGPGEAPSAISVWAAEQGSGLPATKIAEATSEYEADDWYSTEFEGSGFWVSSADTGCIWAGVTSSSNTATTTFDAYGMDLWPAPPLCYQGTGPGRGAYTLDGVTYHWGHYNSDTHTVPVELFAHLGFGDFPLPSKPTHFNDEVYGMPHDVECYQMVEPSGEYVEEGVPIIPRLAIANIGRQAEPVLEEDSFPVKFIAVDTEEEDTVFLDSAWVTHIGWLGEEDGADSLGVDLDPWTPESRCDYNWEGSYREYELIGLVRLTIVGPDESDHCPYNDTIRKYVTCLWSHDLGVNDMNFEPPPNAWNGYEPGTVVTVTAEVENYGFQAEQDFILHLIVTDPYDDLLLWQSHDTITSLLDWRGNTQGNPYIMEHVFPPYTVIDEEPQRIECRVELANDQCEENNSNFYWIIQPGITEDQNHPETFALDISSPNIANEARVKFAVPHETWVKLDVFDVGGRWVTSIANDIYESGYHEKTWNGRDAQNRKVAAGVYLVRMDAGEFDAIKKVIILN